MIFSILPRSPQATMSLFFFEENGYVFAEFNTTVSDTKSTREETIRCYLPADKVQPR